MCWLLAPAQSIQKNITTEDAGSRRIKQFRIVVTVFCGLLYRFAVLQVQWGIPVPLSHRVAAALPESANPKR
jgi:hypothetical protein